jgi:uncharacterized protein YbjT (DUF2867 family)
MTPRRQFTGYMTGRNNWWLSITGTAEAAATNGPPLYECPAEKFNAGWQRGVAAVNAQFVASNSSIRHLYWIGRERCVLSANPAFRHLPRSFLER